MIKKIVFGISITGILLIVVALFLAYSYSHRFLNDLPQRAKVELKSNGGTYVSLNKINPYVPHAAVASQDEGFYTNSGIDAKGTVRAVYYSITTGKRQGASTITEQLIKNVYFSDIDNFKTDVITKFLAVVATTMYPKNTILELYLNSIYYGHGVYGIEKASSYYFNESAINVSLAESSYLIALINAPSYLGENSSQAVKIARTVLELMAKEKYVTNIQLNNAVMNLDSFRKTKL